MKRGAEDQLTPTSAPATNGESDADPTQSFERASSEKLKGRRILKARRLGGGSSAAATSPVASGTSKLAWNLTAPAVTPSSSPASAAPLTASSAVKVAEKSADTNGSTSAPDDKQSPQMEHDTGTPQPSEPEKKMSLQSSLGGLGGSGVEVPPAFSFGQLTSKSSPSALSSSGESSSSSGGLDVNWKFNFETSSPFKFGSASTAASTSSPSSALSASPVGASTNAPLSFGSFTHSPLGGGLGADPSPKIKELFRKVPATARATLLEDLTKINEGVCVCGSGSGSGVCMCMWECADVGVMAVVVVCVECMHAEFS
jgi:NUP50 (Nucleoporin 50 kDa)